MNKYKKSGTGYIVVVAKQEKPEDNSLENSDEKSSEKKSSDDLSNLDSGERYISFSEAGFEAGTIDGKDAYIPTGESLEQFSVEGTSNKLVFIVAGKDKYNPTLVDVSNKEIPTEAFSEMQGMSGKEVSSQLFKSIISEYSTVEYKCELMDALESISKEEE